MIALTCNVGSSTAKLALFRTTLEDEVPLERSTVPIVARDATVDVTSALTAWQDQPAPQVVGHRVVHGGAHHVRPELIDDELIRDLEEVGALAPLHQPACLRAIRAARAALPDLPHVACFDTAFHASLGPAAATFPVEVRSSDLRRYGFHGLSYEYVVRRLGAETLGRAVIAHLGSGASVCAVVGGRSVDTTMGLTPTGGLVMGTRTGDLDPGLVLTLVRRSMAAGGGPDEVERELDERGGLLALSGQTSDMRELLDLRRRGDAPAALAVDVFCRSARRAIAGAASVLGGLDTLVFTGGVGSGSAEVRRETCRGLSFMGVVLDHAANDQARPVISPVGSPVTVRTLVTDEDAVLARSSTRLLLAADEVVPPES